MALTRTKAAAAKISMVNRPFDAGIARQNFAKKKLYIVGCNLRKPEVERASQK